MTHPALINPQAPNTKRPAAPQGAFICLAAGGVLLAAGCYLGTAPQGDRTWTLMLLFFSVVLFAIAGALEFRHRTTPSSDKVVDGPIAKVQIAATPSVTPRPPLPAELAPGPGPGPAKSTVTALAVVVPTADSTMSSQAAPHRAEPLFDVAALTKLPLSDLLLAARCKDPEGARRIFAQALLQTDPGGTSAPVPQSHDVPQPASERGS